MIGAAETAGADNGRVQCVAPDTSDSVLRRRLKAQALALLRRHRDKLHLGIAIADEEFLPALDAVEQFFHAPLGLGDCELEHVRTIPHFERDVALPKERLLTMME